MYECKSEDRSHETKSQHKRSTLEGPTLLQDDMSKRSLENITPIQLRSSQPHRALRKRRSVNDNSTPDHSEDLRPRQASPLLTDRSSEEKRGLLSSLLGLLTPKAAGTFSTVPVIGPLYQSTYVTRNNNDSPSFGGLGVLSVSLSATRHSVRLLIVRRLSYNRECLQTEQQYRMASIAY